MFEKAQAIQEEIRYWRRKIHQYPELGFQEVHTSQMVADICRDIGWRVQTGVGKTGVVAEIGSGRPRVGLRADMDALPLQETNDVPYASVVPGVMHACGHDAHTAMLLGAAKLLASEQFEGSVRLIFQPAEEVGDEDGISGAVRMIQDGAAEGLDGIFALHVDPDLEVGKITIDDGYSSAGVDTFYGAVVGNGGHGAYPHRAVDPIFITSLVIQGLNGIVSRRLHPFAPAVVSVGAIHGGAASNVIPDEVELCGTIRYLQPEVQEQIHTEVERAFSISRSLGGDYRLKWEIGYPPMLNHAGAARLIQKVASEMLGEENVGIPEEEMGAEDFGFFTHTAPGAMFYLGAMIEGDIRLGHHSRFDLDERCLPVGTALLVQVALSFLQQKEI